MDNEQGEEGKDYLTPQAAVFGNHLILEIILRQLSTANLRNAQLVNKFWNTIASSILRKERRLKFRFSLGTSIDFIRAVTKGSCATVYEWEFGTIGCLHPRQIADHCKPYVEAMNSLIAEDTTGNLAAGLVFKIEYPLCDSEIIFSFIETVVCCVRNLAILTLDLSAYYGDVMAALAPQALKIQNLHLPHLEQITFILKWSGCKPLCKLVMNAAPNLKVIKGSRLPTILDTILECGKGACVKSHRFEPRRTEPPLWSDHMETMFRRIDSLIKHTPALELLCLHSRLFANNKHDKSKAQQKNMDVWTAIHRLVVNYRKSLRYIQIDALDFLDCVIGPVGDNMEVPVFENLEYFYLTTDRLLRLLPLVSLVKNQFPCLSRVKFELIDDSHQEGFRKCRDRNIYTEICPLPTVWKLELSGCFDKRDMYILSQLFPNVKEVKIYQVIGRFMHSLQNGLRNMPPSVECLTLHFMANNYKTKLDNLDELFTGIRKSTLAKLPRDVAQDAYLKIASRNGIRKLKALKRLRIIFDVNESELERSFFGGTGVPQLSPDSMRENMEIPFFIKKGTFTALSSLYAFSSPDFQTYIYYDRRVHCASQIENMIQELQPHVIAAPYYITQPIYIDSRWRFVVENTARSMGIEVQFPTTGDPQYPPYLVCPIKYMDWTIIEIT